MEQSTKDSRTVMIVDDDLDLKSILTEFLEFEGIDVLAAANGFEALEILGKQPLPRLMIVDISMPGMDGGELIQRLRQNTKTASVPVILCSAWDNLGPRAVSMGAQGHLQKPYNLDAMSDLLDKYVKN